VFFYYYLTFHVGQLISGYVQPVYAQEIQNVFASFGPVGVFEYLIPIFIASAFFGTILKGSWGYGILLIVIGLLYGAYYFYLYEAGVLFSGFPVQATAGIGSDPKLMTDLNYLIVAITILFIALTIESIVRGAFIIARRPRQSNAV